MVTTIVQFKVDASMTRDQVRKAFADTAPRFQSVEGLIRKYYLISEDGRTAGGVYLWRSKADAERFYTEEWKGRIKGIFGAVPSLSYFETPVIVDNKTREVIHEAA